MPQFLTYRTLLGSSRRSAACSFSARSRCRAPILAFFRWFTRNGINSKLAMTLSSSGAVARGMM